MPTTTNHDNQIAAFLARQPYVDAATKSSDEPQVIFKGALDLDVVQENSLVTAALKYREELLRELGADATHNIESEDIPPDPALDSEGMTWMQERCLWDLVYRQRMGWRRRVWVNGFSYVQVDAEGQVAPRVPGPKRSEFGLNRGLRLEIEPEKGGQAATLYYISLNLDDRHLKNNPGFAAFIGKLGSPDTLLKATSYMLHSEQFTRIRSLILERSGSILQDDSGIPWRYFAGGPWQVQLYGDYVQPYGKSFQFRKQPDLRAVYEEKKDEVRPLKFRIGYGAGRVTSNLQLARRRG